MELTEFAMATDKGSHLKEPVDESSIMQENYTALNGNGSPFPVIEMMPQSLRMSSEGRQILMVDKEV